MRQLVEEAYRSNAGLVAPKYVDWDEPRRLLAVGAALIVAGQAGDLREGVSLAADSIASGAGRHLFTA